MWWRGHIWGYLSLYNTQYTVPKYGHKISNQCHGIWPEIIMRGVWRPSRAKLMLREASPNFLAKALYKLQQRRTTYPRVSGPDLHEFVHRSKNNVLLGPKFHKYPVFESNTHQIPLETLSDNP